MGARTAPSGAAAARGADAPAPNAYRLPPAPAGPAFSVPAAARPRADAASDGPGPGAFEPARLPPGPAATLAGRARERAPEYSDAPLQHQVEIHGAVPRGPASSFPVARRPDPGGGGGAAHVPGVGSYRPTDPSAAAPPAYTMAGRRPDAALGRAALTPAPGDHHVAGAAAAAGPTPPAWTMAGRRWEGPPRETPGPGSFEVAPLPPSTPAFTMPSGRPPERRACRHGPRPGPGDHHREGPRPSDRRAPAHTLAGRPPPAPRRDDGPGPSAAPHLPPGGPAYSLGTRPPPPRRVAPTPGPGHRADPTFRPAGPAHALGPRADVEPRGSRELRGPATTRFGGGTGRGAGALPGGADGGGGVLGALARARPSSGGGAFFTAPAAGPGGSVRAAYPAGM